MTLYNTGGQPGPARTGSPFTARRSRQGLTVCGVIAAFALAFYLLNGGVATSQDAGGTPSASPAATPQPDAPRIIIDFTELNDSGVSGTATLYAAGSATIIELDLAGTGEEHPAHIHAGTCDDIQPEPEYNLQNAGEAGASTSQVDVPLDVLIDGDYVIDLHLAVNQLGTLIVCGEIAGQPTNAAGTPVAVGGQGDATETPGTATASATSEPVTSEPTVTMAPTAAPTAVPTTIPPTATVAPPPTALPTQEATTAPASPDDDASTIGGVGGQGDGTQGSSSTLDSGKGSALATTSGKGGATGSTGDGTAGGSTTRSGKGGSTTASTTASLAGTGSGSSLVFPETPYQAAVTASGVFSVILFAAAMLLRRGQTRYATSRWRRLGL